MHSCRKSGGSPGFGTFLSKPCFIAPSFRIDMANSQSDIPNYRVYGSRMHCTVCLTVRMLRLNQLCSGLFPLIQECTPS